MSDIVERWMWGPPGEIIERLVARTEHVEQRGEALSIRPIQPARDRYYTQARRLHVKQLMKGRAT